MSIKESIGLLRRRAHVDSMVAFGDAVIDSKIDCIATPALRESARTMFLSNTVRNILKDDLVKHVVEHGYDMHPIGIK